MKALVFSDGGEASEEQLVALQKAAKRFPDIEIEVLSSDDDLAADYGIALPPGLVIDGIILSVGRVLSPGRIRRFILQHRGEGESDF